MTCSRCAGLIVKECLFNPADGPPFGYPSRRCLNCGAVEDDVIVKNRFVPQPLRKSRSGRHHRVPVVQLDYEQV